MMWTARTLDLVARHECATALAGRHALHDFTPTETDHVNYHNDVHRAQWLQEGDLLEFWITADAFMRQMNRILVGTMLEVAARRRTPQDFATLLRGASRADAGPTAPPHGLALAAVGYPPGA